jgi:hypothetical protein
VVGVVANLKVWQALNQLVFQFFGHGRSVRLISGKIEKSFCSLPI